MWTMMNGCVCSTCQLWKLSGTRWNFPYSARSHSYTLQVPFARTTGYFKSFVKPPSYGINYRLRTSHLRLLPPLREHVCFFTMNYTYTLLLCFSSFCLVKWSVLACMLPMYPMSCTWLIIEKKKSARNCIGWNGVGTCLSLAHVQHSEVATHGFFSWTWGLLLVACRWCRRVKLGACMKGKHSALVQPEEVGHAYGHAQNSVSHMVSNIAHQRGNSSRSAFLYLQVPM